VNHYDAISDPLKLREAWDSLNKRPQSVGLDQVHISDFKLDLENNLLKLSEDLKNKTFQPVKLLPSLLKKPEGGYRVLKIPAVRDRVVQRALLNEISPALETAYQLSSNGVSFAYVKDGGVKKAAEKIIEYWKQGNEFAYKADIKGFFDNINKKKLQKMISDALGDDISVIPLIELFINNEIENIKQIADKKPEIYQANPLLGLAQGSPLSPVFANVYLAEFDVEIKKKKLLMVRYADDLVILTKTLTEAQTAHTIVESKLKQIGLEVHKLKTQGTLPAIGHSRPKYSEARECQNLEFLGLTLRGKMVYPSGRSYQNAIKSVRYAANDRGTSLVRKLNSIESRVLGWSSAYLFAQQENAKISNNDRLLDDVLRRMLHHQGLRVRRGLSPHRVLGLANYTSTMETLRNKKLKRDNK
jgi:group II intron reverse transcriptase/maturase